LPSLYNRVGRPVVSSLDLNNGQPDRTLRGRDDPTREKSSMRKTTFAAGALACTAVVLGTAPAMAASPVQAAAAGTPTCATSQLTASLGGGDAGAGNLYRFLLLTNHSRTTCELDGYPGLSLLNAHGQQLGAPATFDHSFSYYPVAVRPGQSVSDTIHTLNAGATSCQGTSTEVRIYPPGNKADLVIPGKIMLCGHLLTVSPFGPGTVGNPPDGVVGNPVSVTSSASPTSQPTQSSGASPSQSASAAPTSQVGVVPSGAPDTGVPTTGSGSDTGLIAGACAIGAALLGGLGVMLRRRSQVRG
jgi:LPXTG-motif cell wall-anchored protein